MCPFSCISFLHTPVLYSEIAGSLEPLPKIHLARCPGWKLILLASELAWQYVCRPQLKFQTVQAAPRVPGRISLCALRGFIALCFASREYRGMPYVSALEGAALPWFRMDPSVDFMWSRSGEKRYHRARTKKHRLDVCQACCTFGSWTREAGGLAGTLGFQLIISLGFP